MVILIDSSVLIAAERGQLNLSEFLSQQAKESFAISAVTVSELLHGVHRASSDRRAPREAFVEQLLSHLPVLPFDAIAARIHARLWAELAEKGQPVGAHDLLIAATALANGARIATRDERSFRRIPGLSVLIP